jgi:hypothetical protein
MSSTGGLVWRGPSLVAGRDSAGLSDLRSPGPPRPRDAYIFFISGAKERNPAAAMALIERLS